MTPRVEQVSRTECRNGNVVSTIRLVGFRMTMNGGDYETAIMTEENCIDVVERYHTAADAILGHAKFVQANEGSVGFFRRFMRKLAE